MRRAEVQLLDQCAQIVGILSKTALTGRGFALAVPTSVKRHDPKCLAEQRHHRGPVMVVTPRAVDHHEWLAATGGLVIQIDVADVLKRHVGMLRCQSRRNSQTAAASVSGPV